MIAPPGRMRFLSISCVSRELLSAFHDTLSHIFLKCMTIRDQ